MGIPDRIAEAKLLWAHGQFDGAFLLAAVAVAATSVRRYPAGTPSIDDPRKRMPDEERFVRFLGAEYGTTMGMTIECGRGGPIAIMFRGKYEPLAYVIYKFMRCSLVHEGDLPDDVRLAWKEGPEGHIKTGNPATSEPFELTVDWIGRLLSVVENAPENRDLFVP